MARPGFYSGRGLAHQDELRERNAPFLRFWLKNRS